MNAVARRLETCLRAREEHPTLRNNDLVARLEGDQFVILLDGLKELGHAVVAADRILATVLAPYRMGAREIRVSTSVGIALSATAYTRAEDAMRDADTALHRAKLLGGNRCEVFDAEALRSVQTELQLESDFGGAIERGEFVLFYQPIVSVASNQILGFEALVRWQHPILGLIPPLEFIPIAEKTGFIVPLGNWVAREACRQVKAWQGELPGAGDLWVSVNLSSLQLNSPTLVDDIAGVLRDTSLEPRCLVVELTESQAMENPAAVQTVLMQLRARGLRVSVDDFGTGHSALAHLRQLPLDLLKVDRSFVRGIEAHKDMKSILSAVMALARELGLQAVAEGIEKTEQLELVRSLGCHAGQGFLFSKPVDSEAAAELFKTGVTPKQTEKTAPRTDHGGKGRQSGTLKSLYAAAAVLAVVASVGLPGYFSQQPVQLPTAPAPPRLPAVAAPPVPQIPDEANHSRQLPVAPVSPSPVSPVSPVSPGAARRLDDTRNTGRAANAPAIIASAAPVAPATRAVPVTPPASGVPASSAPTSVASLRVVHQHRIGYCRGLLVVSDAGLSYVPGEADQRKDAFSFGHDQFLHELKDESLTIRSTDRAYRFKAADAAGNGQLAEIVKSITRLKK